MATVDIKLGNNTINGVDTIKLTNASDNTKTDSFVYGTTPSTTTSVTLNGNTISNINAVVVKDSNNNDATFGYQAPSYNVQVTLTSDDTNNDYCGVYIYDGTTSSDTLLLFHTVRLHDSAYITNITCTSGHLLVYLNTGGVRNFASFSCTGGVSVESTNYYSRTLLVTGDGTISASVYGD